MVELRTQTMMEIYPITRHLEEFSKKFEKSMCYFIAPTIYPDSKMKIEYVREKKDIFILPKTIEGFLAHLDMGSSLYFKV